MRVAATEMLDEELGIIRLNFQTDLIGNFRQIIPSRVTNHHNTFNQSFHFNFMVINLNNLSHDVGNHMFFSYSYFAIIPFFSSL